MWKRGSNDRMDKKRSVWAKVNEFDHPSPYHMVGEWQQPAGLAVMTAVAGTGRLEIGEPVGLRTKENKLIYHDHWRSEELRSKCSKQLSTNLRCKLCNCVHLLLCLFIIIIRVSYCCISWLGKSSSAASLGRQRVREWEIHSNLEGGLQCVFLGSRVFLFCFRFSILIR